MSGGQSTAGSQDWSGREGALAALPPSPPSKRARQEFIESTHQSSDECASTSSGRRQNGDFDDDDEELHGMEAFAEDVLLQHRIGAHLGGVGAAEEGDDDDDDEDDEDAGDIFAPRRPGQAQESAGTSRVAAREGQAASQAGISSVTSQLLQPQTHTGKSDCSEEASRGAFVGSAASNAEKGEAFTTGEASVTGSLEIAAEHTHRVTLGDAHMRRVDVSGDCIREGASGEGGHESTCAAGPLRLSAAGPSSMPPGDPSGSALTAPPATPSTLGERPDSDSLRVQHISPIGSNDVAGQRNWSPLGTADALLGPREETEGRTVQARASAPLTAEGMPLGTGPVGGVRPLARMPLEVLICAGRPNSFDAAAAQGAIGQGLRHSSTFPLPGALAGAAATAAAADLGRQAMRDWILHGVSGDLPMLVKSDGTKTSLDGGMLKQLVGDVPWSELSKTWTAVGHAATSSAVAGPTVVDPKAGFGGAVVDGGELGDGPNGGQGTETTGGAAKDPKKASGSKVCELDSDRERESSTPGTATGMGRMGGMTLNDPEGSIAPPTEGAGAGQAKGRPG